MDRRKLIGHILSPSFACCLIITTSYTARAADPEWCAPGPRPPNARVIVHENIYKWEESKAFSPFYQNAVICPTSTVPSKVWCEVSEDAFTEAHLCVGAVQNDTDCVAKDTGHHMSWVHRDVGPYPFQNQPGYPKMGGNCLWLRNQGSTDKYYALYSDDPAFAAEIVAKSD